MLMIPVSVLPNFKITSPTAGFIYPQGAVVDVRTSLDGNSTQWKEIQWTLNQKPWLPGTLEPPHKLALTEVGTYTLKAEYVVGPDQTWSHSVSFTVKPVKVSILPVRKVLTFSQGLVFPLQGKLDFDGKVIEDSEKPLDLGNGASAKVTKVEWSAITNPAEGVEVALDKNLLKPDLEIKRECAVTALATVSVSISKAVKIQTGSSSKTQLVEESFVLPSVRADLWVISSPEWSQLSGHFPGRGINGTRRTFFPEEGSFTHDQKPFSWNSTSGISPQILLEPALSGVQAATCQEIGFSWKGPENQTSDALEFPVLFSSGNFDQVQCTGHLRFDEGAKVAFPEKTFTVTLQPLEEVVAASVAPATFSTSPGAGKRLTFILQEKGIPPVPAKTLYFWKGEYQVDTARVSWSSNGNALGEGNPFDLSIPVKEQQIIKAKGMVSVQEADVKKKPAPATSHTMTAEAQAAVIRLIAYPGAGYAFPAKAPFTLKARTDTVDPSQISWKLNDATIGVGPEVPIQGLAAGDYTISASTPEFPGVIETRKIKVFDWSFALTPNEKVFLWEGKPFPFPISAQAIINGKTLTSSNQSATVEKAKVQVAVPQAIFKADLPDCASVATFSAFVATGTFNNRGRIEILASSAMEITQPDTLKESFPTDYFSVLAGAVEASATYAFALEPKQAIVGTQRLFVVGSITVRLPEATVVVDRSLPFHFEPPVELVKPLLTDREPISATEFDHYLSTGVAERKEYPEGISMQPVFFSDSSSRKAVWSPFVKTSNSQNLLLASTHKALKPFKLFELLNTRISVEKPVLISGEPTKVSFFFGPKDGIIDSQTSVFLFGADYQVTLKDVEWYSNGKPLAFQGPNISFSHSEIGRYNVSASATFFIEPKEGKEFGGDDMVEAPSVLVRVIKGLRIKNLETESFASEHKLSYRAKTKFAAFLEDDLGNQSPVSATWNLVATSGWEIKKGGKREEILTSLGIPKDHQFIGYLPASSSTVVDAHVAVFTSMFSGKVDLVVRYNGISTSTALFLSQPTVYLSVKAFENPKLKEDLGVVLKDFLDVCDRTWGNDNLIKIVLKESFSSPDLLLANATFTPLATDSSYEFKLKEVLNQDVGLSNPLMFDSKLNFFHNAPASFPALPRQADELLKQKRGQPEWINVYIASQPYMALEIPALPVPKFVFLSPSGFSPSSDDALKIKDGGLVELVDHSNAGIVLRNFGKLVGNGKRLPGVFNRVLAHEIGHLLIQNGDEHKTDIQNDPNNLMLHAMDGENINPLQFLRVLDHNFKKKPTSFFILEVFSND
jgi:hypothetical protein